MLRQRPQNMSLIHRACAFMNRSKSARRMLRRLGLLTGAADDGHISIKICRRGWEEAAQLAQRSRRPDPRTHVERVRDATLAVRNGAAVATRDSVILSSPEYQFALLAGLLKHAVAHETLNVVDFGGSLGSMYFQFKRFAPRAAIRWNIVELPEMVDCGKEFLESDELGFHGSLEECLRSEHPQVGILSGVLHFVSEPYPLLATFAASTCRGLIIDRVPLTDLQGDMAAAHMVSGTRFASDRSFPCWLFSSNVLKRYLERDWEVISQFPSLDSDEVADGVPVVFNGFLLERAGTR